MTTLDSIEVQQQRIARFERHLALQKVKQQKAEMSHIIELGRLVNTTPLARYPKEIIAGVLLDACEKLKQDESLNTYFQSKGEAFLDA